MPRKRQPGTVFQRGHDRRWVAQIRKVDPTTGTTKVIRRYAGSEKAAKELLRTLRTDDGPFDRKKPEASISVADWLVHWTKTSLPASGLKPTTVRLYRGAVEHPLKPTLGRVLLERFTAAEAEQWLLRLAATTHRGTGEPLSVARQRTAFNVLTKALDVAVRDGRIAANPLRRVKRPTAAPAVVPVADAEHVDDVLLPALEGWQLGPLVSIVVLTGCRVGEALALTWADVDLANATAVLRRSGVGADSTKGGHARAVPLIPELVDILKAHREGQGELRRELGSGWPDTGLVFTSMVGTPLDAANCRRRFRAKLIELGLPAERPFHSLRHGLAARLLRRDVPLPVVSALLGHSSIRVTADVYGHVQPALHAEQLARAMGRGSRD